jgi:hypothetical protein
MKVTGVGTLRNVRVRRPARQPVWRPALQVQFAAPCRRGGFGQALGVLG